MPIFKMVLNASEIVQNGFKLLAVNVKLGYIYIFYMTFGYIFTTILNVGFILSLSEKVYPIETNLTKCLALFDVSLFIFYKS